MEDRYEYAMASHLVAFAGITSRSASNEDGNQVNLSLRHLTKVVTWKIVMARL
jgi:hypothetical protein